MVSHGPDESFPISCLVRRLLRSTAQSLFYTRIAGVAGNCQRRGGDGTDQPDVDSFRWVDWGRWSIAGLCKSFWLDFPGTVITVVVTILVVLAVLLAIYSDFPKSLKGKQNQMKLSFLPNFKLGTPQPAFGGAGGLFPAPLRCSGNSGAAK